MDSQTSVERLPSPRVRRAHRRARSHASRLPGRFAARSRSPKRLTQDPQPTHKTMRPPAGRGFGGGGRGFGGRSPGGRGFGGRGGRGGRGGFDEGPPDTVVGAFSYASRSLHASRSAGGRVERRPAHSARRNCWFTLVASGGVGVKSAAALSPLSLADHGPTRLTPRTRAEVGTFMHACEGEAVCKLTNAKVRRTDALRDLPRPGRFLAERNRTSAVFPA